VLDEQKLTELFFSGLCEIDEGAWHLLASKASSDSARIQLLAQSEIA
jgi:hypothetical protein